MKNFNRLALESIKVSNRLRISPRMTNNKKLYTLKKTQKVIITFTQKIAKKKS
jgi:hypothetical protein